MAIIPPEQFNTSFGEVSVSHQSFSASINVCTSPKPPSNLRVGKVGLHSISITWVAPKIAKGSTVTEFLVKYVVRNNEGNRSIPGTEKIRSAQKNSSFLVTDLAMGTLHGISVAVTKFHISNSLLNFAYIKLGTVTRNTGNRFIFLSSNTYQFEFVLLPRNIFKKHFQVISIACLLVFTLCFIVVSATYGSRDLGIGFAKF